MNKQNEDLDALRGFCAIGVALAHVLGMPLLDKTYIPGNIFPYFSVGGLAVHIFFILSGYVISLSVLGNNKASITPINFYKRRLVRLYPAYLVAFLSLFILGTKMQCWELMGNIFFLQNENSYFFVKIPVEGNLFPNWSINYEIVYYLIFPLIWKFKPNLTSVIFFLFSFSLIGYYSNLIPIFLTDYFIGYIFWIIGVYVCWSLPYRQSLVLPSPFLSYIFLILCFHHLSVGSILLKTIHFHNAGYSLGIEALFNLPLCLLVVIELSEKEFKFKNLLKIYSYVFPFLIIFGLWYSGRILENYRWISCTLFYTLSLLFYNEKSISNIVVKKLSKLGKISYGIYLFHVPIALIIGSHYPIFGTAAAFFQKFIIWIICVLLLSYFVEQVLQPRIKKILIKS